MTVRPIIFSGSMILALLEGRKTMTRRVLKHDTFFENGWPIRKDGRKIGVSFAKAPTLEQTAYRPGDLLYLRENFSYDMQDHGCHMPPSYWYWADGNPEHGDWSKPKPSIHMPRSASRLTLEVTCVKVERLQDISEEDAKAEGVESLDFEREDFDWKICPTCGGTRLYCHQSMAGASFDTDCTYCDTYIKRFQHLWTSIHAKAADEEPWQGNPWVCAVSFRCIHKNVDQMESAP